MNTLHPSGFIETQGCDGPRLTRGQPSRESPGVIMTEIQDRYIPEFELPYRNIERYIKEMNNNWDRLDPQQRESARALFDRMGMKIGGDVKESFSQDSILNCAKFISKEPNSRPRELLSMLWNPTDSQKASMTEGLSSKESEDLITNLRNSVYDWTTDQSYGLYTNWKSGLMLFFVILLFLLIGVSFGIASK